MSNESGMSSIIELCGKSMTSRAISFGVSQLLSSMGYDSGLSSAEREEFSKIEADLQKIQTNLTQLEQILKNLVWQHKIDTEKIITKIEEQHNRAFAVILDVFNEMLEFESDEPQEHTQDFANKVLSTYKIRPCILELSTALWHGSMGIGIGLLEHWTKQFTMNLREPKRDLNTPDLYNCYLTLETRFHEQLVTQLRGVILVENAYVRLDEPNKAIAYRKEYVKKQLKPQLNKFTFCVENLVLNFLKDALSPLDFDKVKPHHTLWQNILNILRRSDLFVITVLNSIDPDLSLPETLVCGRVIGPKRFLDAGENRISMLTSPSKTQDKANPILLHSEKVKHDYNELPLVDFSIGYEETKFTTTSDKLGLRSLHPLETSELQVLRYQLTGFSEDIISKEDNPIDPPKLPDNIERTGYRAIWDKRFYLPVNDSITNLGPDVPEGIKKLQYRAEVAFALPVWHLPPKKATDESYNPTTVSYNQYRQISQSQLLNYSQHLWNGNQNQPKFSPSIGGYTGTLAMSRDGKRILANPRDSTVKVLDLKSGTVLHTLSGHTGEIKTIVVTPDGKRAISGSEDHTLKVWDLDNGHELRTLSGHTDWISAVAVAPDGKHVISGSNDHTLKVWDLDSGRELRTFSGHKHVIMGVGVTLNGTQVVSNDYNWNLKIWNLNDGQELRTLSNIYRMAVTEDGRLITVGYPGNLLEIQDLKSDQEPYKFDKVKGKISALAVAPNGKFIIAALGSRVLRIWDLNNIDKHFDLKGHSNLIRAVQLDEEGKYAASCSYDHKLKIQTLKVWDLVKQKELNSLRIWSWNELQDNIEHLIRSFDKVKITYPFWDDKSLLDTPHTFRWRGFDGLKRGNAGKKVSSTLFQYSGENDRPAEIFIEVIAECTVNLKGFDLDYEFNVNALTKETTEHEGDKHIIVNIEEKHLPKKHPKFILEKTQSYNKTHSIYKKSAPIKIYPNQKVELEAAVHLWWPDEKYSTHGKKYNATLTFQIKDIRIAWTNAENLA